MTIINSYYKKPIVNLANTNFVKPKHLKNVLKSQLSGSISISLPVIAISLFVCLVITYVMIYSNINQYDYKIYTLKTEIQKTLDENNGLKEVGIKYISPDKISDWAKANNFVEISSVNYFNLQGGVVAVNAIKNINQ